ncbi:MAG: hypothetical protein ACYC2P_11270 [Paludibacteraceae bacterium]
MLLNFVNNRFLLYSLFVLINISFFSCKDGNEYRVSSDFEPYVIRFENEAEKRGDTLNIKSGGLIIEYGNLKNDVAGLCHYEQPIRIEIDRDYWEKMGKYAGADLIREELIFHEMGHGLLSRKHLNTILTNDEWKSIMCGGDKINNRTWNVNYRGQRRDYYLNELFRESTTEPSFFSAPSLPDISGFTPVLSDNFDSSTSTIWKSGTSTDASVTVEKGMLRYVSKSDSNVAVLSTIPAFNIQSDFMFEFTLQYKDTANSAKYGLAFGTVNTPGTRESVDFFVINNNQALFMGNTSWYSFFTQVKRSEIIPKEKNKLRILKTGEMLYLFINDRFAYASEIENKQSGSNIGFMVPAKQTLYLDDFRLYKRSGSTAAAKISVAPTEKLTFKTMKTSMHELKQKN